MQQKIIETKIDIYRFDELSEEYQNLVTKSKKEVEKSYAPYSNFNVGAAVLLENGETVTGNNQENSAYSSGLCAERVAMFYANAQYPSIPVKALAISAFTKGNFVNKPITPCGACRQVLLETEVRFNKDITILLYGTEMVYVIRSVKDLLPLSFEKDSLKG